MSYTTNLRKNQAGQQQGERRKNNALDAHEAARAAILRNGRRFMLKWLLEATITIDDVREGLDLPADLDPRFLGALPIALNKSGIIKSMGFVRSARPECHARMILLWTLCDSLAALNWLRDHPEVPAPHTFFATAIILERSSYG